VRRDVGRREGGERVRTGSRSKDNDGIGSQPHHRPNLARAREDGLRGDQLRDAGGRAALEQSGARGGSSPPVRGHCLGSWKAGQISDGDPVSVTVPVRRGRLLSLIAPIPPATATFLARATVHPAGSVSIESVSKRLASLLPPERKNGCLLELAPEGAFLTYRGGVSLRDMAKPAAAIARVPVA
jgi:hypothetical protein